MTTKNWTTIAEPSFPWEREALEFVRSQFPSHDPYKAWSNFEFIADDGSVNEVDLLVFTPHGFFLIEIKSRPAIKFMRLNRISCRLTRKNCVQSLTRRRSEGSSFPNACRLAWQIKSRPCDCAMTQQLPACSKN